MKRASRTAMSRSRDSIHKMLGGEDHGVVWDACSMITTFTIDAIQKHVWIIMFFTCITPVLLVDKKEIQ